MSFNEAEDAHLSHATFTLGSSGSPVQSAICKEADSSFIRTFDTQISCGGKSSLHQPSPLAKVKLELTHNDLLKVYSLRQRVGGGYISSDSAQ